MSTARRRPRSVWSTNKGRQAIRKFRAGEITFEQACKEAGVSLDAGIAGPISKRDADAITRAAQQYVADLEQLLPLIVDQERDATAKRTKRVRLTMRSNDPRRPRRRRGLRFGGPATAPPNY